MIWGQKHCDYENTGYDEAFSRFGLDCRRNHDLNLKLMISSEQEDRTWGGVLMKIVFAKLNGKNIAIL